jgi:lipoprotein-anchoring transpeptidase ErfK/SrfK
MNCWRETFLRNGLACFLLMAIIGALAACTAASQHQPVDPQLYADEPFRVRPVARERFDEAYRPVQVTNVTGEKPGTIVIDTAHRQLFYVINERHAMRYGVAVGATGKSWTGRAVVGRKAKWPQWYPTDEMRSEARGLPASIPAGADNPLGARALYLYQNGRDTLYRIHGTSEPWTIGTEVSSGCIRMINEDIIALFDRVPVGAQVIVR